MSAVVKPLVNTSYVRFQLRPHPTLRRMCILIANVTCTAEGGENHGSFVKTFFASVDPIPPYCFMLLDGSDFDTAGDDYFWSMSFSIQNLSDSTTAANPTTPSPPTPSDTDCMTSSAAPIGSHVLPTTLSTAVTPTSTAVSDSSESLMELAHSRDVGLGVGLGLGLPLLVAATASLTLLLYRRRRFSTQPAQESQASPTNESRISQQFGMEKSQPTIVESG